MKTRIFVNQHIIRSNRKNGTNDPPITARTYKETRRGNTIKFSGDAVLVYRPDKPLKCGARCWIETDEEVIVK